MTSETLIAKTKDKSEERAIAIINRLFPQPRSFDVALWTGNHLYAPGIPRFTLKLNNPAALRRMCTPPLELSLGEAYIHSDFDIEGDIFEACYLLEDLLSRLFTLGDAVALIHNLSALPRAVNGNELVQRSAKLKGRLHSPERDKTAIQYHYDVSNEFYALWLDEAMQYSCAYFPTGCESLDRAQELKMEHLCRKLHLKPGDHVLDVGCGWGGFARYAAEHYGARVLGVTLSEQQMSYANYEAARCGLGDRVVVKLQDYRGLAGGSFDKIVSVGMFEHVGRARMPEYFAQVFRLLKPGGLFLNHGISARARQQSQPQSNSAACCDPRQQTKQTGIRGPILKLPVLGQGSFIQRYVFPDGELVPVSELNVMAEQAGFEVRDVENLREHYALTLRHWVDRLESRRSEAIALVGEVTYRIWRIYMAASVYAFETGRINVNQTLLAKLDHGKCCMPSSRADLYVD
jgi:cyclopropane-fatty-acyl-phospholipid synthase